LQSEYPAFIEKYPNADTQYRKLLKVLCTIEGVAGYTPTAVGESAKWMAVVSTMEENWARYCKALSGKTPFSALYGTYTVALQELKTLLKVSTTNHKPRRSLSRRRASKKFGGTNATAARRPELQRRQ
jgi:hypothetical protein